MNQILLLTLYKQHYRAQYDSAYHGEYSCWGYYDGMSLVQVPVAGKKLIHSTDSLHLTDAWYTMAGSIIQQTGKCIQQNICLLKDVDKGELDRFISQKEILMCISIVQMVDKMCHEWQELIGKIENMSEVGRTGDEDGDENSAYGEIMAFRTVDNADLILVMKGNSYKWMEDTVREISKWDDVVYTHSICGVKQDYLGFQEKKKFSFEKHENMLHDLRNDPVTQLILRVVMNGNLDAEDLKKELGLEGKAFYALGHTDVILTLNGKKTSDGKTAPLTMRDAVRLMRNNEGTGHGNVRYGKEIYNIESIIALYECQNWQGRNGTEGKALTGANSGNEDEQKYWCIKKIEKLKNIAEDFLDKKNEVMYSCYQAMIQSLNMLAPYEESCFSKDIFYMVFPSLWLFHNHLDQSIVGAETKLKDLKASELETLFNSLTRYLDAFDPILYRSIHTEQTFLMVPGYGGALYTIPSKLCLMYTAFLRAVIQVLNESAQGEQQGYTYECILSPVVNSKPVTSSFDFNLDQKEQLIEVKISQRCLFVPHLMCLILCHEMNHYVGEAKRCRDKRLKYMCYILGAAIGNAIFDVSKEYTEDLSSLLQGLEEEKIQLSEYLYEELYKRVTERCKKENSENETYFDDISLYLVDESKKMLSYENTEIRKRSNTLGESYKAIVKSEKIDKKRRLATLMRLYQDRRSNFTRLIQKDYIEQVVNRFQVCFKETYADVLSLAVLDVEAPGNIWLDYLDAFWLSEGMESVIDEKNMSFINRIAAVVNALAVVEYGDRNKWIDKWNELKDNNQILSEMQRIIEKTNSYLDFRSSKVVQSEHSVRRQPAEPEQQYRWSWEADDLINTQIVWEVEEKYLTQCLKIFYDEIKKKTENNDDSDSENIRYINEIHDLYYMLKSDGGDSMDNNWLKPFDEIISHFKKDVKKLKKT